MIELHEQDRLKTDLHTLIAQAKKQGATAVEVSGTVDSGFSATVRMGTVDTLEYHQDNGFAVVVYFGQSKGSASTTDTSLKAMQETLQAACDIARFTEADAFAGLADADKMAKHVPDLDLYHPWNISPDQAIELAIECESKAFAMDKRISNSDGACVSTHLSYQVYANSHGFMGAFPSSSHSISCALIAEQKGDMQRDHDYSVARDAQDLATAQSVAAQTVKNTLRRLDPRSVKTCQLPVIFEAPIAAGLVSCLLSAISGGSLYRKNSFLLDHLHKPIFPSFVEIDERPHLLKALGSAPFDGDGLLTREKKIIENGILQTYLLSTYSARKLGMQSTANAGGAFNVHMKSGDDDLAALLKKMDKGILVTELMGQGVNLLTGDYSRGAFGFWVEDGEIQYPIHGFTIAGNLKDMFANLVAVGNDVDLRHSLRTGSILLERMTIAGD